MLPITYKVLIIICILIKYYNYTFAYCFWLFCEKKMSVSYKVVTNIPVNVNTVS